VWGVLVVPGRLTLPRLHDVSKAAMGWTNSHLHRFRTVRDHVAPCFLTEFDLAEGDQGVPEDDVRLDQVLDREGAELWYEYDFGDGWDHSITVEQVLDEPPAVVRCLDGALACPPEDSGGIGGYGALAAWVRSGHDDALLPEPFESARGARAWLPDGWDPDRFDLDQVNVELAAAGGEPVKVGAELQELMDRLELRGILELRRLLAAPATHGRAEVTEEEAVRITAPYRVLLDAVGEGVTLTGAGYLPPAVVERIAIGAGITNWWIGKANREDLTPPVARLRAYARALGLVSARKGRLAPTAAARRCRDALSLWRHLVSRLPLGTAADVRESGWMALCVAASDRPVQEWAPRVSELLSMLGWRDARDEYAPPPADSPTLEVLMMLGGFGISSSRDDATDPAIGVTARAVISRIR